MSKIVIKEATCTKCGKGKRVIDIDIFKINCITITNTIIKIWKKRVCWLCKKHPEINEKWSISISNNDKNRVWCEKCSKFIESKLNEI